MKTESPDESYSGRIRGFSSAPATKDARVIFCVNTFCLALVVLVDVVIFPMSQCKILIHGYR
jgi:hypothetical protein